MSEANAEPPSPAVVRTLLALLADLAVLPAQGQARARHAVSRVARLTNADAAAVFLCAPGGSQPALACVQAWGTSPGQHDLLTRYAAEGGAGDPLLQRLESLEVGATRVGRRRDHLPDAAWYDHPHVNGFRRRLGLDATAFADAAASSRICSLLLYRTWGAPPFTPAELEPVELCWTELVRILAPTLTPDPEPNDPTRYLALTQREAEVARLICKGFSNRRAGDLLAISHETVKSHVKEILRKADVSSRTELAYLLGGML